MAPTPPRRLRELRAFTSRETTGGILIMVGAVVGLALANSPARDAFDRLSTVRLGPAAIGPLDLHLDLTVTQWAQDGLLAIFFFTVGLELAQEFRVGSLRNPRQAAVPMLAAAGGVVTPALIYLGVMALTAGGRDAHGWAIPTATDIAFAVGILTLFGRGLPGALRSFLLTLAVVDDLIAIIIIAVAYPGEGGIVWQALAGAVACVALFGWLIRRPTMRWWLLVPVAVVAWAFMHASGVHATIAGVALGLTVPPVARTGETYSRGIRVDRVLRPLSNGVALPVFAVFGAAIPLQFGAADGQPGLFADPLVWAIVAALVIGKPLGVLVTTASVTAWTRLHLPDSIGMRDLLPVGLLCGIGFTVSLLIAGLSFTDAATMDTARAAILVGSVISAVLGVLLLRYDARRARRADMNRDGTPDVDRRVIH